MAIAVKRLSGNFGAEVSGIDLAQGVGDNLFADLKQTWLDHGGIMVVRDQHRLSPQAHVKLARRFGPLLPVDPPDHAHHEEAAIYRVSFAVDDAPKPRAFADTGSAWHSDYADTQVDAGASILHVVDMPPRGGDIFFADCCAAYDALSPAMQRLLAPLKARHSAAAHVAHKQATGGAIHPIVRRHPDTGRPLLFVSPGFTTEVVDLAPKESRALLAFLHDHVVQPAFILRHRWIPGDLVFWDNRCNLHNALPDYAGGGRVTFHRVSVASSG